MTGGSGKTTQHGVFNRTRVWSGAWGNPKQGIGTFGSQNLRFPLWSSFFSWFDKIDFDLAAGIVFTAGGLSYRIINVVEKDYADGYLKGGYHKTPITRLFNWTMRTFHMSFMLHVEFQ